MDDVRLTITSNKAVSDSVYLMRLEGDCKEITKSGQFINIKLPDKFLRRPISVCDYSDSYVDILYKVLGQGTKEMSQFKTGITLDVLVGLGNGFDIKNNIKPLLVAGGIGIAPLISLAKKYNEMNIKPILVYGAAKKSDLVLIDELEKITDLRLCTDDGSLGYKGNTVSYLKENKVDFDYYYACGPQIMLKFLSQAFKNGCVSLEARMGCGFGCCMGCSINTINGPKRVCKEGPVFEACEVEL